MWNWKKTAGSRWTCFGVRVLRTLDYPTVNLNLHQLAPCDHNARPSRKDRQTDRQTKSNIMAIARPFVLTNACRAKNSKKPIELYGRRLKVVCCIISVVVSLVTFHTSCCSVQLAVVCVTEGRGVCDDFLLGQQGTVSQRPHTDTDHTGVLTRSSVGSVLIRTMTCLFAQRICSIVGCDLVIKESVCDDERTVGG